MVKEDFVDLFLWCVLIILLTVIIIKLDYFIDINNKQQDTPQNTPQIKECVALSSDDDTLVVFYGD